MMWRYAEQEIGFSWSTGGEYLIGTDFNGEVYAPYTRNEYPMWMSPDFPEVRPNQREQGPTSQTGKSSITYIRNSLLSLVQNTETLPMPPRQRDEFEDDISKLFSILNTARRHGRELLTSELMVIKEFLANVHYLLEYAQPWVDQQVHNTQTPWPSPDDPCLYMHPNEMGYKETDKDDTFLHEHIITHSYSAPITSAPSWAPLEGEFLEIKEEESYPYGNEQASFTSSWEDLDHDTLTKCSVEAQTSTELASTIVEEPPLVTSCLEDLVIIPPSTSHPSHHLKNSISEPEIEHIEMVLPLCHEIEKEMVWNFSHCPPTVREDPFMKKEYSREGILKDEYAFVFPRVGVG